MIKNNFKLKSPKVLLSKELEFDDKDMVKFLNTKLDKKEFYYYDTYGLLGDVILYNIEESYNKKYTKREILKLLEYNIDNLLNYVLSIDTGFITYFSKLVLTGDRDNINRAFYLLLNSMLRTNDFGIIYNGNRK